MPACKAIRDAELRAICTTCASRVLASKSNIGADLRAPCGVRMVWWGFGALKTPRRASSLPTLQRRPDDRCRVTVHWTNTGQILDVYWTPRLQPDCTSTAKKLHLDCTEAALMLHLCCTGVADQGAAGSMPRHRTSGEKNDLAGVALRRSRICVDRTKSLKTRLRARNRFARIAQARRKALGPYLSITRNCLARNRVLVLAGVVAIARPLVDHIRSGRAHRSLARFDFHG